MSVDVAGLAARAKARAVAEAEAAACAALPRTEKLHRIIEALKGVPGHEPISPTDLSAKVHFVSSRIPQMPQGLGHQRPALQPTPRPSFAIFVCTFT